jgi:hypothetical protein
MLVAFAFAVLVGLEWRYRLKGLRLAATALALVVMLFAQPSSTRAARSAISAPPGQRVTELGSALSEYESGVETMRQAVEQDSALGSDARLLSVAVLVWLACSPVISRGRGTRETGTRTQQNSGDT